MQVTAVMHSNYYFKREEGRREERRKGVKKEGREEGQDKNTTFDKRTFHKHHNS